MKLKFKDYLLVSLQLLLFVVYILDIEFLNLNLNNTWCYTGLIFACLGGFIMLIAIMQLNKNLSPFPSPKSNSALITSGLYKYIRHPIYTGILFTLGGYAIFDTSSFKLLVVLLLLILFIIKSNYEEQKLELKFKDYKAYKTTTGRFLPRF